MPSRTKRRPVANHSPVLPPGLGLTVEHFGPIAHGSIQLAPLTVLAGKNSTGKSYMASLLWSILNVADLQATRPLRDLPNWYFDLAFGKGGKRNRTLSSKLFEKWLNSFVNDDLKQYLMKLFSSEKISAGKITVHIDSNIKSISAFSEELDDDDAISSWHWPSGREFSYGLNKNETGRRHHMSGPFLSMLSYMLVGKVGNPFAQSLYLPAARTGLIQALAPIMEKSLDSFSGSVDGRATFTRPVIRFLQSLARVKDTPVSDQHISRFIENEILHGTAVVKEQPVPEFFFKGHGFDGEIPVHLTSSMVTEILPFLLLIKNTRSDSIVFEEPEAHLHLDAQRSMARTLVRIVNSGTPVIVTTHSDTFIQQLNVLMSIGESSNSADLMETFKYEKEDIIRRSDIRCYEFLETAIGTIIEEVVPGDSGFAISSINETIYELSKETIYSND